MVLQFEKFKQPLLVMGTIPFCLIGVVLGLMIFGSTLSLISLMGIIALAGVVVNNGIILIDYINLLRKQNLENNKKENNQTLKEIIITGSASRVRPILMTTLTTMLGVVPMAMAKGEGAEIYAPLGQAISGGLLTSTIITLFIIPVLYFITEKNKQENKFNEDIKDEN
jgi:HAE1 family hydrophobic/amphiphilic exporter-1